MMGSSARDESWRGRGVEVVVAVAREVRLDGRDEWESSERVEAMSE
jgi:hypothetical protein